MQAIDISLNILLLFAYFYMLRKIFPSLKSKLTTLIITSEKLHNHTTDNEIRFVQNVSFFLALFFFSLVFLSMDQKSISFIPWSAFSIDHLIDALLFFTFGYVIHHYLHQKSYLFYTISFTLSLTAMLLILSLTSMELFSSIYRQYTLLLPFLPNQTIIDSFILHLLTFLLTYVTAFILWILIRMVFLPMSAVFLLFFGSFVYLFQGVDRLMPKEKAEIFFGAIFLVHLIALLTHY